MQKPRLIEAKKSSAAAQSATGPPTENATNPVNSPATGGSDKAIAVGHINSTTLSGSRSATQTSRSVQDQIPASAAQRVSIFGGDADSDRGPRASIQPEANSPDGAGQPSFREAVFEALSRIVEEKSRREREDFQNKGEMLRSARERWLKQKSESQEDFRKAEEVLRKAEEGLRKSEQDLQSYAAQECQFKDRLDRERQQHWQSILDGVQKSKDLENLLSAFREINSKS